MKNIETNNSNINKNLSKGAKLLLAGAFAITVLGGCSSVSKDEGVINEGKEAEKLNENDSKNLEIGVVTDKMPNAEVLDKEDKGYLAYYELYKKDDAGEWQKQTDVYFLGKGNVNIGYERHNEANTIRRKCIGYMIVPIKYEKINGKWKKFGKDLLISESDEWVEIDEKFRTNEELENAQKSSFCFMK